MPNRKTKKYTGIGKTLILLGFLSLVGSCGQSDKNRFQGYVEGENVYMASPNSGVLKNLAVYRGDKVKKNQLLFELDPEPQSILVKQYTADLAQAEHLLKDLQNPKRTPEINAIRAQIERVDAALQLAKVRVDRYQRLYEKHAAAKDTVDEAVAAMKEQEKLKEQYQADLRLALEGSREEQINAQELQVQSIKAKLEDAKWQLKQKAIYAPDDGLIYDTFFDPGEFVGAQQAVLALLIPSYVYIEFFVPAETVAKIKLGQKVKVLCDGCDKTVEATIDYIASEAEFVPPLVYTRSNNDKLIFRINAHLADLTYFKPGQPVMVFL